MSDFIEHPELRSPKTVQTFYQPEIDLNYLRADRDAKAKLLYRTEAWLHDASIKHESEALRNAITVNLLASGHLKETN